MKTKGRIEGKNLIIGDLSFPLSGDIDLRGINVTSLPDNLAVGGTIHIKNTSIDYIPDNLSETEVTGFNQRPDAKVIPSPAIALPSPSRMGR